MIISSIIYMTRIYNYNVPLMSIVLFGWEYILGMLNIKQYNAVRVNLCKTTCRCRIWLQNARNNMYD